MCCVEAEDGMRSMNERWGNNSTAHLIQIDYLKNASKYYRSFVALEFCEDEFGFRAFK